MKKEAAEWEFPLAWDECRSNPLAGPLTELEKRRLETKIDSIHQARRVRNRGTAWKIRGLDVLLTSDGSLFIDSEASLGALWELFLDLRSMMPELVLEDRITQMLHNEASLFRLVLREQSAMTPFDVEEGFHAA